MGGWRGRAFARGALVALAATVLCAGPAHAQRYGALEFPKDEHQHVTGWDWWWGAAHIVTRSGQRYTLGYDFDSYGGVPQASEEMFALTGPYKGRTVNSIDGLESWGHAAQTPGRVNYEESVYVPGLKELMSFRAFDAHDGAKTIAHLRRTTLEREEYQLSLDQATAHVHPTGEQVKLAVDLKADMKSPPLLAGGTGKWWYRLPESNGDYPSRSFHYVQGARRLTGTIELEQPDGSVLREALDPARSRMVMVHEYDASPEDLFAGLAVAESSQLHPRYAPYYQGGMPWELEFIDLDNGAQLMLAVLAFHDTKDGTAASVTGPDMPTYAIDATVRLPDGTSVPVPDVHVEHLNYRKFTGIVPTFAVYVNGVWTQSWDYRVSYPGGTQRTADGKRVRVPAFDLGLTPQVAQDEPRLDDKGQGLTQRVPIDAAGSWGGCPVRGFGYSELIINWYGREDVDPWFTGGALPKVPAHCGDPVPAPPGGKLGDLDPAADDRPPEAGVDPGCTTGGPDPSTCSFDATMNGAAMGIGPGPGDWTVTITRRGESRPIVISGFGGHQLYPCGAVRPGDHVVVTTKNGATAGAGNPVGTCI